MSPQEFISKWRASTLNERAAAQPHFIDLCRLLDEPDPIAADPSGAWYRFEKPAPKTLGGDGFTDVWKRGHFGWEYKGKHRDLHQAYAQLLNYSVSLENPPLLIGSDMDVIRIHTNFTNSVQQIHSIRLDDLLLPQTRALLKSAFTQPDALRPGITREALTADAATRFGALAKSLRDERHHPPLAVAHFITRIIFCLFAEDIGLLPERLFTRLLENARNRPESFAALASKLFAAMSTGGDYGVDPIEWFNGGLFDDGAALPLTRADIDLLLDCALLDWSAIEPSIFGTLFERGLDPDKRSQLGAHYTDRQSILRIIQPVVLDPLAAEWASLKSEISALLASSKSNSTYNKARSRYLDFLARLRATRVLDPACGSGNFLYLTLLGLKDLEYQVIGEASELGFPPVFPEVDPRNVLGIELNAYAAELARVTIWIGQIQWMLSKNLALSLNPVLQPLNQIENRDALLTPEGIEAGWPEVTAIVGNPPFLGDKKMISGLGEDYAIRLRQVYAGRVPGGADLVTYWFEKARYQIERGHAQRAGLVATNSIRGGANRQGLDRITQSGAITHAWSDEPWIIDGAAVRVSLVCFAKQASGAVLDGQPVSAINPDLTSGLNITETKRLPENLGRCFQGTIKTGPFDIPGEFARQLLQLPMNPNGQPNSDVVRPWANGMDITRRPSDTWIIDFGVDTPEAQAALYEQPFEYVKTVVRPTREGKRESKASLNWWLLQRPRPEMRAALVGLSRYIVTPSVAKHRVFAWMDASCFPDHQLFAIARDDDATFGILHSRFHELWALRLGTSLEDRPRYTPTTTFETFPFPEGMSPNLRAAEVLAHPFAPAIAEAARELNQLRENWLNPPDLVHRVPEVVPGFPDLILPNDEKAAAILKKRTLTNLYNERPTWLRNAHARLDNAVANAYGFSPNISDDDALARLLCLNQRRPG